MTMTRREFLGSAALAGAGLALLPTRDSLASRLVRPFAFPRTADTYFEWSKLAQGVHAAIGEGGNSLLIVTKDEAIIADSKNTGFGAALKREAEALAGVPVKKLINTHHHYDHTGGNCDFIVRLTPVESFAHPKAIARIPGNLERYKNAPAAAMKQLSKSDKPGAKAILDDVKTIQTAFDAAKSDAVITSFFVPKTPIDPSVGSSRKPVTFTWGGIDVAFHHVGAGHTDNDLFIHLPKLNVVHTGDLVFHAFWPYVDRAGGCDSKGWLASLAAILALCDAKTVVLPGHGAVTDKTGVQKQIDFFNDMREKAAKAVAAGTTRDEFLKLTPEAYKDYAAADWIRPITLGGLWDEAKGVPAK